MAETCSRKLIVEVCNAKNLMPKDGQGTASAYAIVDYDGQRRRTKTKFRDLNPEWDEKLEFLVHDNESMADEILEINLYNDKKTGKRSTFLGKVKIAGSGFVKTGSETLVYHPLEKRSVFSQIKGELGLKVYYIDEDPPAPPPETKPDAAAPVEEKATEGGEAKPAAEEKKEEKPEEEKEEEKKAEACTEEKKEEKLNPPAADGKDKKPEAEKEKEKAAAAEAPPPAPAVEVENPPLAEKTTNQQKDISAAENAKTSDLTISDLELRSLTNDRSRSAYDLVDRMPFLYVRVLKAKKSKNEKSKWVDKFGILISKAANSFINPNLESKSEVINSILL